MESSPFGERAEREGVAPGAYAFDADEVWIIAKPKPDGTTYSTDAPGTGAMLANFQDKKDVPLPLKHTGVIARVAGYIATVEVTQQFHNPFDTKIEASYVFPLPQNAAVNEFLMTIGERSIRGIIRERQEAEQIYQQARAQGYVASLLTQERPNIFTQKVANIEPGKQVDVNITYFNTLVYVDGWYEFVFPMVVGPRYNPPGSTDGIDAVARGNTGVSGQATEVPYLAPDERSGHDIALSLDIDAGVAIESVTCNTHTIKKTKPSPEKLHVQLSERDRIPNKDFVLRYQVAGKRVKSALVTHQDKTGGYFSLMLYPPADHEYLQRSPMEMIFVLDCSGSMRGAPLDKSKGAITRALKQLRPNDTFQVIRFSNNASQLGKAPLPATDKNIQRALDYVANLQGTGGTQMIEGIKAALDFHHDPERLRLVSFMTDGYIGNESDILDAIHDKLGAARLFSFGIGSSVNRYLLERMAALGQGAVAYIGPNDDPTEPVDLFYQRISHPALTDIRIDFGSLEVSDVFPQRIPDLFVGRPILLTGRFRSDAQVKNITVTGKVLGQTKTFTVDVNSQNQASHPGIASVWARKKIEILKNRSNYDSDTELSQEILKTALTYNLISDFTAFIAVDSSYRTQGDHGVSVVVPVPVPDGVRYDTTVHGR